MTPAQATMLNELMSHTDTDALDWQPITEGARRRMLHSDDAGQRIQMVQWDPGFALSYRDEHHYDEFVYILEGDFVDQHRSSGPGTFIHSEPGSWHQPSTVNGVTFLAFISPRR